MPTNGLMDQAEQLRDYLIQQYGDEANADHLRILQSVVDAARAGPLPDTAKEDIIRIRDENPCSTIARILQGIMAGETEPVTNPSLGRWVDASNKGGNPVSR
jgi:hypothetical protein